MKISLFYVPVYTYIINRLWVVVLLSLDTNYEKVKNRLKLSSSVFSVTNSWTYHYS